MTATPRTKMFGPLNRVVNLLSGCPEISGLGRDDRDHLRDLREQLRDLREQPPRCSRSSSRPSRATTRMLAIISGMLEIFAAPRCCEWSDGSDCFWTRRSATKLLQIGASGAPGLPQPAGSPRDRRRIEAVLCSESRDADPDSGVAFVGSSSYPITIGRPSCA